MTLSFSASQIFLYILLSGLAEACLRTSTYYRSQYRSQTHVFIPEEYRPMRPERSLEASGPLETQDFQSNVPSSRLVRMDAPHLQFAHEEARWMSKVSICCLIYLLLISHKSSRVDLTTGIVFNLQQIRSHSTAIMKNEPVQVVRSIKMFLYILLLEFEFGAGYIRQP